MNGTRLRALIVKESLQVVRDPASIMIAFIVPLILLFIFGYGVSLDTDNIRVGLVLEDRSEAVQSLVTSFRATKYLKVSIAKDRRAFEDDILSGRIRGLVVIPQDFSKKLGSPDETAAIQVISDGTEPNTAAFVQNYTQGVVNTWLQQRLRRRGLNMEPPVEIRSRFWYNPSLESRNFLIPGSIGIVMALIGTLLTALVIAREWERGTMEAMLGTPMTVMELLVGKMIPYFVLGLGSMFFCAAIAVYYYNVPFRGSLTALTLVSGIFLFAALGQGVLISTLSRNQFVASQAALITGFLPAFMLSGFIFEIKSMPGWLQVLTHVFAVRYLVTNLKVMFLTGDIWSLLLPNCAAMFAIGCVFFAVTAVKTSRRIA